MPSNYGSNLDDYGFEKFEENQFPIAYLLTWRTYGTWLHGDERQSMQRSRDPRFGTIKVDQSIPLVEQMAEEQKTGFCDPESYSTKGSGGVGSRNLQISQLHLTGRSH